MDLSGDPGLPVAERLVLGDRPGVGQGDEAATTSQELGEGLDGDEVRAPELLVVDGDGGVEAARLMVELGGGDGSEINGVASWVATKPSCGRADHDRRGIDAEDIHVGSVEQRLDPDSGPEADDEHTVAVVRRERLDGGPFHVGVHQSHDASSHDAGDAVECAAHGFAPELGWKNRW